MKQTGHSFVFCLKIEALEIYWKLVIGNWKLEIFTGGTEN